MRLARGLSILFILSKTQFLILLNFFFLILFILGCAGSSLLHGLSLVLASGDYSSSSAQASHWSDFSCFGAQGPRHSGLQQLQLLGSRAQLWHAGLVALKHVGSSQTKDQTHVVSPTVGVGFFTTEPWGKPGVGVFFLFFFLISVYFLPDLYYFPPTDLRFCFLFFSDSFRWYVRLLIWDFFSCFLREVCNFLFDFLIDLLGSNIWISFPFVDF